MPANKTKAVAVVTSALLAGLGALSLTAHAGPIVRSAKKCTLGKEQSGCVLKSAGYLNVKSGIVFQSQRPASASGPHSTLSVPGAYVCDKAKGATVIGGSKKSPKIGGSVSLSQTPNTNEVGTTVTKTKMQAKVEVLSAKKAKVSGSAGVTFADGSTCHKTLSGTLKRALGG